jgi:hypothetical protein
MAANVFDKASRAAAQLDPPAFLGWLLNLPGEAFAFRGWLDARRARRSGRTCGPGNSMGGTWKNRLS